MSTPPEPVELTCEGLLSEEHDRFHFLGRCPDCDAYAAAGMTLEQVENWYRQGVFGQDLYEGFCWVWATSAPRFGNWEGWEIPPAVATAREAGERIRVAHAYRKKREGRA